MLSHSPGPLLLYGQERWKDLLLGFPIPKQIQQFHLHIHIKKKFFSLLIDGFLFSRHMSAK